MVGAWPESGVAAARPPERPDAQSAPSRRRAQPAPVLAAVCLFIALVLAAQEQGRTQTEAAFLGLFCGFALYHARFGFTGGWRRMTRERRGAGVRSQLLLLAMIVVCSYPLIAYGGGVELFGAQIDLNVGAWVFPVSLSTAIGAAVFGFGMQLGGGCGSGTLFTVGGGSTRMVLTLLFFLFGSVLYVATNDAFAEGLDAAAQAIGLEAAPVLTRRFSFVEAWGAPLALGGTLLVLAALWGVSWIVEKRAHGAIEPRERGATSLGGLMRGPWTKTQGAVALAVASIVTLLVLNRPWGVTAAFPSWGGKLLDAAGAPIREWEIMSGRTLDAPLFAHVTGVMDFGLMLGALAAAGFAGRFAPTWRLSARDVWTAVVGGLLMGYGARLAFGCNIGGLVGGIASASLHGWWWLLFGWLGSWAGVRLRGAIGMDPRARA